MEPPIAPPVKEAFNPNTLPEKPPRDESERIHAEAPPPQESIPAPPLRDRPAFRGKTRAKQKLTLRSRTKNERKRLTGSLKRNRGEAVRLAPTYKILPKREEVEEMTEFKTKNPRARAKIKKVMERWEPK